MFAYDIIEKKRNKKELSKNEIDFMVNSFVKGKITDAQMSAFLMAVVLNVMSYEETYCLTHAMKDSGKTLEFPQYVVDKHSTGGVSDSTTLIVVPILASLGISVAKMSGRSLGLTGGTIDKLEVFNGYKAEKGFAEFKKIVDSVGCSIISQTENLAYADKLIYALRNETATVDSIALIASSVMSKKLASGAKFLLLNVHFGSGAFMKTKKDAITLAKLMVKIGNDSNIPTRAIISNMNTPLASGVGSGREVASVIDALNNPKTDRSLLLKLSKEIAARMVQNVKKVPYKAAINMVEDVLNTGVAKEKLKEMIKAHSGDETIADDSANVTLPKYTFKLISKHRAYISEIDAMTVARVVKNLRDIAPDADNAKFVGVDLQVSVGDSVKVGDVLAVIHSDTRKQRHDTLVELETAFDFSRSRPKKVKLIEKNI